MKVATIAPKPWNGIEQPLGFCRRIWQQEREITLVAEIDAPDLNAWLAYLRKSPGGHGKVRSERTIQTYARSVRAFFHWLIRRKTIETNPFERVVFPKVGKPLIQTIEPEEFERLLVACTPPNDAGPSRRACRRTQSCDSLALLRHRHSRLRTLWTQIRRF